MIKLGNNGIVPKGYSKIMRGSSLVWENSTEPTFKRSIDGSKQGTVWNLNSELRVGCTYVFKINGILENGVFVKASIILQNGTKRVTTLNFDKYSEARWECTEVVTNIIVQQVRGWTVIQTNEYK